MFNMGCSLKEIGKAYGITYQRVKQIIDNRKRKERKERREQRDKIILKKKMKGVKMASKDILLFNTGKCLGMIKIEFDFDNECLMQLIDVIIDGENLNAMLFKDMDYAIVIPEHTASEMKNREVLTKLL